MPHHTAARYVEYARYAMSLIIHDMKETSRLVLKETDAFGIVEVRNSGNEMGDTFSTVLLSLVFEYLVLNEILQPLVGEVDVEFVK